ncbi:hypothetical protein [Acidobacterium sp. S8]|uniref:hypothetical protein n=1 Tax=Acidobacterium sp. S8 TaxID=1641854 RepID=UPI00131DCE6D|nr:hypothetical protein [Acidobacterium sp. S8]
MQRNKSEFERALASYADPAEAGHAGVLTARVMAAVEARGQRRAWFLRLGFAIPVLACLLLTVSVLRPHAKSAVKTAALKPAYESAPATPLVPHAKPHVEKAGIRINPKRSHPLPKLDQFPAADSLSEQERRLVSFATHAPPVEQSDIAQAQEQGGKPLHIADLDIPPITHITQP